MPAFISTFFSMTPVAFWRWGRLVLGAGLALGLLLVVFFAWAAPDLLLYFPIVLLAGAGAWFLFRHETLNLCMVLAGAVLIAQLEEGLQATEVLYGLYYLTFLAYWFGTRLLIYGEHNEVFRTGESRAIFLFLILVTLSIPLSLFAGSSAKGLLSEWIAYAMLGLYFPVKELCARHRHGVKYVLLVIGWIGLFTAVKNLVNYQAILASATQAWQIVKGRVSANDTLLAFPSLFYLVLLIFSDRWRTRLPLLLAFLLYFSGLILTQSRGYWVSFLLGAFVMFVLVDRRYRLRLAGFGALGFLGAIGLGAIFVPEYLFLILSALGERFVSLGSAGSSDISLINRFYESAAVWEYIKDNPILGHGMSRKYFYFDITEQATRVDWFIHNAYVALWYKFGIWGLGLVVYFWAMSWWRGIQAFRTRHAELLPRLAGLGATMCLTAMALAANTSNPFGLDDSVFIFSVACGVAAGSARRVSLSTPPEPSRQSPPATL